MPSFAQTAKERELSMRRLKGKERNLGEVGAGVPFPS